jgi:hypothetical protein
LTNWAVWANQLADIFGAFFWVYATSKNRQESTLTTQQLGGGQAVVLTVFTLLIQQISWY